jgi:hypothetical protein
MHNTRLYITYDTVTDWDLEQIAKDHANTMISDFDRGLLESYISDIEESVLASDIHAERKEDG